MNEIKNDSAKNDTDKKGYYAIIKANGDLFVGEGDASKHVPLEFMQEKVGGHIERVHNGDCPVDYWVDEEGALKDKRVNYIASGIVFADNCCRVEQDIFGDMLVLAHEGENTRFLTEEECDMIRDHYLTMAAIYIKFICEKNNK